MPNGPRTAAHKFGAYTPEYQKRRTMPVPKGFVAVANETRRHPLVHVVKAETFGGIARQLVKGEPLTTLCEKATISAKWSFVPRVPDGGYLVSCAFCRARMLEGIT